MKLIDAKPGMLLGTGYNSSTGEPTALSLFVDGKFSLAEAATKLGTAQLEVTRVRTSRQLQTLLEVSASFSYGGLGIGASAKADFVSEFSRNTNDITFLLYAKTYLADETIDPNSFTLKPDAKILYHTDRAQFTQIYGDSVIWSAQRLAEFYVSIRFHSASMTAKQKLVLEANSQFGPFGGDASMKKVVKELSETQGISIKMTSFGTSLFEPQIGETLPKTLDRALQHASQAIRKANDTALPISFGIIPTNSIIQEDKEALKQESHKAIIKEQLSFLNSICQNKLYEPISASERAEIENKSKQLQKIYIECTEATGPNIYTACTIPNFGDLLTVPTARIGREIGVLKELIMNSGIETDVLNEIRTITGQRALYWPEATSDSPAPVIELLNVTKNRLIDLTSSHRDNLLFYTTMLRSVLDYCGLLTPSISGKENNIVYRAVFESLQTSLENAIKFATACDAMLCDAQRWDVKDVYATMLTTPAPSKEEVMERISAFLQQLPSATDYSYKLEELGDLNLIKSENKQPVGSHS